MRISDWSSDVCSSDLQTRVVISAVAHVLENVRRVCEGGEADPVAPFRPHLDGEHSLFWRDEVRHRVTADAGHRQAAAGDLRRAVVRATRAEERAAAQRHGLIRSEEHTSELQSLMRISYAVFCLKKNIHSLPHPIVEIFPQ